MTSLRLHRIAAGLALAFATFASLAQGYPGGGTGRTHGGSLRGIENRPDASARRADTALRPHAVALFGAALEKESATLGLSPAAASTLQTLARDMKDFAALDDRHAQQRVGLTQAPAHATVDVTRDLDATHESIHELEGAAADVVSGWKKLLPMLDATQRQRVEALYANALLESRRPAANRN